MTPRDGSSRRRLAALGLALAIAGACDRPAGVAPDLQPAARRVAWPHDAAGKLRQVCKFAPNLEHHPELFDLAAFPGGRLPDRDIDPLGVRSLDIAEVEKRWRSGHWAIVDVRRDRDVAETGTIPGAWHREYLFEGRRTRGRTHLTRDALDKLLADHEGVILICNGPRCPRSYNALVAAVQVWGLPSERLAWFRPGVPAWRATALIPERYLVW